MRIGEPRGMRTSLGAAPRTGKLDLRYAKNRPRAAGRRPQLRRLAAEGPRRAALLRSRAPEADRERRGAPERPVAGFGAALAADAAGPRLPHARRQAVLDAAEGAAARQCLPGIAADAQHRPAAARFAGRTDARVGL